MSVIRALTIAICVAAFTATAAFSQEKSRATLILGDNTLTIRARFSADDTPTTPPQVSLYRIEEDKHPILVDVPVRYTQTSSYAEFEMSPPFGADLSKVSYEIVAIVNQPGLGKIRVTMSVEAQISGELMRPMTECSSRDNIYLILRAPVGFVWTGVYRWLDSYKQSGKRIARLRMSQKGQPDEDFEVHIKERKAATGSILGVCLHLDKLLPTEEFKASFDFSEAQLPNELRYLVASGEFDGAFESKFPKDEDRVKPDQRKLERTIDIAGFFGTSVEDKEIPATGGTPASTVRKRKNVGIFDVDFKAPDILRRVYKYDAWIHQLSPFFLKASVSTEKITKDTLSQNRILFGFEGESRYVPKDGWFSGTHRLIWGATHASDRDFKQKEIYASLKYEPLFGDLYRPYDLNYDVVNDEVDYKGYGFYIVPSVGFDFGRTYSRRSPAPAIDATETIKRMNLGLRLGLDITRRISLTAENIFYLRFEDSDHRQRNFFKASGDLKLFRTHREHTAHSLFATYEKGWQAPFSGQQVNSFRIGYRVVGDFFCGVHCR